MTQTIEQLTARVRELEEENARLNSSPTIEACRQMIRDKAVIEASTLHEQLAAEQLNNKLLREALESVIKVHGYESGIPVEAISTQASTEALDAYVAEKVKEAYIPVTIDYGDGAEDVAFGNEHQARRLKKWLDKFFAQKEQIATLTRQRDLAVEAFSDIARTAMMLDGLGIAQIICDKCNIAIDTIKESEAK